MSNTSAALYIPLRSDKTAVVTSVDDVRKVLYIPLRSDKTLLLKIPTELPLSPLYIPLRSDKTLLREDNGTWCLWLYIPLRSDKTSRKTSCRFAGNSFISHYVQIKLCWFCNLSQPCISFISHYVQIKRFCAPNLWERPIHLYIPLRSDKTVAFFRRASVDAHLYIPLRSDKTQCAYTACSLPTTTLYPTTFR